MSAKEIKAVILAAGQGKRLGSSEAGVPKVMRLAAGRPLLSYVLDSLSFISPEDTILIVGYMKEQVITAFPRYKFAEQTRQLGTGHAVAMAREQLEGFTGSVLVCCGDMPLLSRETYYSLIEQHFSQQNDCTILTGKYNEKKSYGRIIRRSNGSFDRIVEQKDCSAAEDAIREYNSGVYVFSCPKLLQSIGRLKNSNAQNEYYLTDLPAIIQSDGGKIGLCLRELGNELIGVNTREELELVEKLLNK